MGSMKLTDPETSPIEKESDRLEGKDVKEGIENGDTSIAMQSNSMEGSSKNPRRSARERRMVIVPEEPAPKALKQNKPSRVPKVKKEVKEEESVEDAKVEVPEEPISRETAERLYPYRFVGKGQVPEEDAPLDSLPRAESHYRCLIVDGVDIALGDTVTIEPGDGISLDFLGTLMEIFKAVDENFYVRFRWFFRSYDTILDKDGAVGFDGQRIWWSAVTNTNSVNTITGKADVIRVHHRMTESEEAELKRNPATFFFNQAYTFSNTSFFDIPEGVDAPWLEQREMRRRLSPLEFLQTLNQNGHSQLQSGVATPDTRTEAQGRAGKVPEVNISQEILTVVHPKQEAQLCMLDLYAGAGALSTGLEMGGPLAGVNIWTKWALDFDEHACCSMAYNHPETEVRNESADDYLELLIRLPVLIRKYGEGAEVKVVVGAVRVRVVRHKAIGKKRGGGDSGTDEASEEEALQYAEEVLAEEADQDVQEEEEEEGGKRKRKGAAGLGGKKRRGKGVKVEEEGEEVEDVEEVEVMVKGRRKERQRRVEDVVGDMPKKRKQKEKEAKVEVEVEEEEGEEEDGEFEVEAVVNIRFRKEGKHPGLQYQVRWKGFTQSEDTWEPEENLLSCEEKIAEYIRKGVRENAFPLQGTVDIVCGGPPCQGASGFNRFRNHENPLECDRNRQLIVFMDIVALLQPRFVLMENVVDLMRFKGGTLAKYAVARLLKMEYQARVGVLIAGCYGVAQYRMRGFYLGAKRGEHNLVAWDEDSAKGKLRPGLSLSDCIRDLPPVPNHPGEEVMEHTTLPPPTSRYLSWVRLPKTAFAVGPTLAAVQSRPELVGKRQLYNHLPLKLKDDDFLRTQLIPKKKGANFRDLEGVLTLKDNRCALDASICRPMLPSGKPLCPDYALSFVNGRSFKPFGRLWWDETVPTVVTRAEPHNQVILHPAQDRVLTVRENARLQGFPDHYRLFGPVKKQYCQVGNAVSVPVAQALGYAIGLAALRRSTPTDTIFGLPPQFPFGNGDGQAA